MQYIRKNFTLMAGDTLSFGIKIYIDEVPDTVYFSCSDGNNSDYIFNKSLEDGIVLHEDNSSASNPYVSYLVRVVPDDTKNVTPKEYHYDLQIGIGTKYRTVLYGSMNIVPSITIL